jgi:hypothetical protein
MTGRVIVVCHEALNSPIKVFEYDDGAGWDRAEEWIENSTYGQDATNISSAKVSAT